MQLYIFITIYTTDDILGMCGALDFHVLVRTHTHADLECYCQEAMPIGVTVATLINKTSVDVTWCYQILIKIL